MVVDRVWVDTPYPCPPKVMVKALVALGETAPGIRPRLGRISRAMFVMTRSLPHPSSAIDIWRGFDLAKALKAKFGKPVRLLNDADMQGLRRD